MDIAQKYRYFIRLSYDGTNYHGWQIQPNAITVQEVLNEKTSLLLGEPIQYTGTGRTDSGVHAKNYIAHINSKKDDLENNFQLIKKLNSFLPKDIAVSEIYSVNSNIHARFDALERGYEYCISLKKNVFQDNYRLLLYKEPELSLLNEATKYLITQNDFTSFCKLHSDNKTNICNIKTAGWTLEGDNLTFNISADRFLRNMVRSIVGTLLDVGYSKTSIEEFKNIFTLKDRSCAGVSAPAKGLFFIFAKFQHNIK